MFRYITIKCHSWVVCCLLIVLLPSYAKADPLKLCTSDINWYPYTYMEGNKLKGLYIDMLNSVEKSSKTDFQITALPWKRCLALATKGKFDGVLGISFLKERAEYIDYPPDVEYLNISDFRLSQVTYVAVGMKAARKRYDGTPGSLPEPVRVPLGFSIGVELKQKGVDVDDGAYSDEINIKKLIKHRSGSVVLTKKIASLYAHQNNDLIIYEQPLKTKSYFLAFSKKTHLSDSEKQQIWQAIKSVRENTKLMVTLEANHKKPDPE